MEVGEPEDVIKYVPILNDSTEIRPYFEIIPGTNPSIHRVVSPKLSVRPAGA
jgi:hypothetical protein